MTKKRVGAFPNHGSKNSAKKAFESHIADRLRKQGYEILILHDPNAWIKDQQAKAAEIAKAEAEAKKKAEKEKFDAAVADAVAKALAEREKAKEQEQAVEQGEPAKKGRKKADKEETE